MWTLAVLVAIYSTLGVAPTVIGLLRHRGMLGTVFVLGMILVGATILTQGLRVRPREAEIGVALGAAAAYVMVLVRMSIPEERTHLIEYGVVAVLVFEALTERASRGRRVPLPPVLAVVATSVFGTLDELIQGILPNRVFALRDILFNVLASVMAVTTMVGLGWARRWAERRRNG